MWRERADPLMMATSPMLWAACLGTPTAAQDPNLNPELMMVGLLAPWCDVPVFDILCGLHLEA